MFTPYPAAGPQRRGGPAGPATRRPTAERAACPATGRARARVARQQLAPVPAAGEEVHAALPQATHNKVPPCSVQAGREEDADATGQMPFRYRAEVASFFDVLRPVPGRPPRAG